MIDKIDTAVVAFPKAKVIVALTDWWADEKLQAEALATLTPAPKSKISILTPIIEIDSHRVVRALLEIEKIIGREVPEKIIKPGGYENFEALLADLLPKVENLVVKGSIDD